METFTDINNSLSKRLKHYRRAKNFSQESLADASGISIRTIQRIETGESIGSAYTLDKLANTLEIEISQLIPEQTTSNFDHSNAKKKLNVLNLSALSVILVPLSNIVFPLLILSKNKGNEELQ
jgi:XRE family transcriptional regulator, regulator of sulfur utilization